MKKRAHVPLGQKCLVGATAALAIIYFAWFHTGCRISQMIETTGLRADNATLEEQLEWYAAIHRDRPPLVVVGPWQ